MAARTSDEEQRRRRRQRIVRGLLAGAAAVGVPALFNAAIARRARRIVPASWGRRHRYAWELGDVGFQRLGEGDPSVVLLHSFGPGHDAVEWRDAARLLGVRRQVFAPDLPGWGRSDRPAVAADSELYIDFLIDFLIDIVRRRAVVVASGLAAAYAIQVAVDRPELVRGLVLVGPLGLDVASEEPDLKDAVIHRLLQLPVLGTSALNLYASRRGIERHLREEVFADPSRVDEALVDHYWKNSHEPGVRAVFAGYLAGYLNHGLAGALPRLKLPTLLVWGRRARHPAVESADLWLRSLPEAELEIVERAGVLPHAEQPERFVAVVDAYLDALPAA